MASPIITLSVGGTEYQTSLSTLTKDPETKLASLFGGSISLPVDFKGRYFIDRDGHLFRYILNYLRTAELCIPENNTTLISELIKEAEFFEMESLLKSLKSIQEHKRTPYTYKEFLFLIKNTPNVQAPLISVSGISLRYLDLSNGNFKGTDFSYCSLLEVSFKNADLSFAIFVGCTAQNTDFYDACLEKANFAECNLSGCDMRLAKCKDTCFWKANLGGTDMRGADLQSSNLQLANMLVANMEGCNLAHAQMQGTNLDGANTRRSRGLSLHPVE